MPNYKGNNYYVSMRRDLSCFSHGGARNWCAQHEMMPAVTKVSKYIYGFV